MVDMYVALLYFSNDTGIDWGYWVMCDIRQYRVLNGMALSYLDQPVPVSSLIGRCRLRSSFTLQLLVPSYRLSTVSRRSFPVIASMFWNTLPNDIQSAPSVSA